MEDSSKRRFPMGASQGFGLHDNSPGSLMCAILATSFGLAFMKRPLDEHVWTPRDAFYIARELARNPDNVTKENVIAARVQTHMYMAMTACEGMIVSLVDRLSSPQAPPEGYTSDQLAHHARDLVQAMVTALHAVPFCPLFHGVTAGNVDKTQDCEGIAAFVSGAKKMLGHVCDGRWTKTKALVAEIPRMLEDGPPLRDAEKGHLATFGWFDDVEKVCREEKSAEERYTVMFELAHYIRLNIVTGLVLDTVRKLGVEDVATDVDTFSFAKAGAGAPFSLEVALYTHNLIGSLAEGRTSAFGADWGRLRMPWTFQRDCHEVGGLVDLGLFNHHHTTYAEEGVACDKKRDGVLKSARSPFENLFYHARVMEPVSHYFTSFHKDFEHSIFGTVCPVAGHDMEDGRPREGDDMKGLMWKDGCSLFTLIANDRVRSLCNSIAKRDWLANPAHVALEKEWVHDRQAFHAPSDMYDALHDAVHRLGHPIAAAIITGVLNPATTMAAMFETTRDLPPAQTFQHMAAYIAARETSQTTCCVYVPRVRDPSKWGDRLGVTYAMTCREWTKENMKTGTFYFIDTHVGTGLAVADIVRELTDYPGADAIPGLIAAFPPGRSQRAEFDEFMTRHVQRSLTPYPCGEIDPERDTVAMERVLQMSNYDAQAYMYVPSLTSPLSVAYDPEIVERFSLKREPGTTIEDSHLAQHVYRYEEYFLLHCTAPRVRAAYKHLKVLYS